MEMPNCEKYDAQTAKAYFFEQAAASCDESKSTAHSATPGQFLWNISKVAFGNVRECLDVYHGLEHLGNTGKVLYGVGTAMCKQW